MKKDIAVTIVLTSTCNMACAYCINNSGNDLKISNSANEWESCDNIIACLKKIEEVRHITSVKLFGGEPTLCNDLIHELLMRKKEFSPDDSVKFAMTTNALQEITDKTLDEFIENRMILNVSLDGPEHIHNLYRVTRAGAGTYAPVIKNIQKIKDRKYPFAAIAVLDERLVLENYSLTKLCDFLSEITPIYKIEPAYCIKGSRLHTTADVQTELLAQEKQLIDSMFSSIKLLSTDGLIYENNITRTICNAVYGNNKKYVCSAGNHIAVYPNCSAYSCYNLMNKDFLISKDLRTIDSKDLDDVLKQKQSLLEVSRYPKEYKDVEVFGDYCAKENNFTSFAYKYRKTMVDTVLENLRSIEPGSQEHLGLMGYIGFATNSEFYKNVPDHHHLIS